MRTLVKTKLIDPTHIEVRDFELGQDLKLIHCEVKEYRTHDHIGEHYMILPVSKQKEGKIINTQMSKFPPYGYYRILKFLWKPKGKIETMQIKDKQVLFKGNTAYVNYSLTSARG